MRFIIDNLWELTLLALVSCAVSLWFYIPFPPAPKIMKPQAEYPDIPQTRAVNTKEIIAAIESRNLWGVAVAAAPAEPEFRILGISFRGPEHFVLVTRDGKTMEMLTKGDVLPDGSKILRIENNRFVVLTADRKKRVLGITK